MGKKKSIVQQYISFKTRNGLTTKQIEEIAEEYANSGPDTARSYFMEKYDISEHVFYRARDFAVICMLVDSRTSNRILEKAAFNSREHNSKKSSVRSARHAQDLKGMRTEYFNGFTRSEIEDICAKYAEGLELRVIANAYDTGETCIKYLLRKGIVAGYINESTYQLIDLRLKLKGRSIDELFKKR